jgi:hypothetical protein
VFANEKSYEVVVEGKAQHTLSKRISGLYICLVFSDVVVSHMVLWLLEVPYLWIDGPTLSTSCILMQASMLGPPPTARATVC